MASEDQVPAISIDHDADDTSSSSVASKSSVVHGDLSARSSVTSLALPDAQKLTISEAGSTNANHPIVETKTNDTAIGGKAEVNNSENTRFNADLEDDLHEKDDPYGEQADEEARGWKIRSLDKRRGKAGLRLKQSKAYSELIEDRILELEKKVRALRRENTPPPNEPLTDFPSNKVDIQYQTWTQFSARPELDVKGINRNFWQHRPEIDTEPKYVIEVLQEAPETKRSNLVENFGTSEATENEGATLKMTGMETVVYPYLIRIRSRLLLKVIKEATDCSTLVGPHKHRMLLLRPYKLLVTHAKNLHTFLEKLEKENNKNVSNGA